MTKFMAITALAVCIGTAAFAQGTGGGGTTSGSGASGLSGNAATGSGGLGTSGAGGMSHSGAGATMQMPNGWSGHIGAAFFRDENDATARSARDIKKNWKSLNQQEQEQAQVRSDCQKVLRPPPAVPRPAPLVV